MSSSLPIDAVVDYIADADAVGGVPAPGLLKVLGGIVDPRARRGVRHCLVSLTTAEPMGRQLVEQALAGRELTWPADHVAAARVAAGIIMQAPPDTWIREIEAVAGRAGLDLATLRTAVVDRIEPDCDALGRLVGRDRRDDLDRGQHVTASPAQLAAMSTPRTGPARPAHTRPADTIRPVHASSSRQARARHRSRCRRSE